MKEDIKLPWRISGFEIQANGDSRMIMGSDGFSVVWVGERSADENHAIAEFIVKACNSHDELVKALENFADLHTAKHANPAIARARDEFLKECPEYSAYCKQAAAALAHARGEGR